MNKNDVWFDRLHSRGFRLTKACKAVVEIITESPRALTPLEVFDSARQNYPALGLVTVYRTLEKLESLGLVQRVHQEIGCNAYLPQAKGHQHLIICTTCGRAEYFTGDDLDFLYERVRKNFGYLVRDHWLQLSGLCSHCQDRIE